MCIEIQHNGNLSQKWFNVARIASFSAVRDTVIFFKPFGLLDVLYQIR